MSDVAKRTLQVYIKKGGACSAAADRSDAGNPRRQHAKFPHGVAVTAMCPKGGAPFGRARQAQGRER